MESDRGAPLKELWDSWNRGGGPKYPQEKVVQFTFRNFPEEKARAGTPALDLGCGNGVHTLFLAQEGFDVTGLDISPVGIEATRRKLTEHGLRAELQVQDLRSLDLPRERYGLVVSSGVLDAADVETAALGIPRVLEAMRPGAKGIFLFASDQDFRLQDENPYRLHGYTRAEVDECFSAPFAEIFVDRYITTHRGGEIEQNDWLVTVTR